MDTEVIPQSSPLRLIARHVERISGRRLGCELKRLRLERRLTLSGVEALSFQHGERVNKSYLFRVERGTTLPSLTRLIVLAQVFGVRLIALLETIESAIVEEGDPRTTRVFPESLTHDTLMEGGISAMRAGNLSEASQFFRAACERASRLPDGTSSGLPAADAARRALARHHLATVLRDAGLHHLARQEAETALEEGDLPDELRDEILVGLAASCLRCGHRSLARETLAGLFARKSELSRETLASAHEEMGSILFELDPRESATHYRAALGLKRKRNNPVEQCRLLIKVGSAERRAGRYDRALKRLFEAQHLSQRHQLSYLVACAASEIGKALYLKADRSGARMAFHEANGLARHGVYYDLLFVNHYYQRRLLLDEGDVPTARSVESSMRHFASRIGEGLAELDSFRAELHPSHPRDRT